jgi:hypothetical protein
MNHTNKPKKKVLIHLGHTKCGSTTIQNFLKVYKQELSEAGYLVPNASKVNVEDQGITAYAGLTRSLENYRKHHQLSESEYSDFDSYFETKLLGEINESDAHTVILSHEGLFPRDAKAMQKVVHLLSLFSDDINALVILRRQDRWAISSYNTRLTAHGTANKNILVNDMGGVHGLNYYHKLKEWATALGEHKLTVFGFEDYKDILLPYMDYLNFTPKSYTPLKANPGMSAYSQEIIRMLNVQDKRTGIEASSQVALRKRLRRILPTGMPTLPSKNDIDAYMDNFTQSNLQLKNGFLDENSAFFSDIHEYKRDCNRPLLEEKEVEQWIKKLETLND